MALKVTTAWAAALLSLLAGCAVPILPADSIDAVSTPRAEAAVVDIDITQDDARRLVVRYRAPPSVTHLDFLLDDHMDAAFRTPALVPGNDCGALVPGGITLRHGAGCERGAVFVVTPKTMALDAMYQPAQPTTDGGVLFYTGYYAAAAAGLALRWQFTPAAGDYGVDDSRRHDTAWVVAPGHVYDGARPLGHGDQREDEAWIASQHALQYVFLGHTPVSQSGGVLWVRDPALPQAITDSVGRAAPVAWNAYARAAGRQPAGPTAVVMISVPGDGFGYHGDRTEGQMLRLSFAQSDTPPRPRDLATWSTFIAHETAHLWNHGVFQSDQARPWLHEGDAEWVALNAMHDGGLLSDRDFVDELQSRLDSCLLVRGEHVAATLSAGRSQDDPYGCGVALHLLGYARLHSSHAEATPLAVWGALHRTHPMLDAAGFAQFFADGGAPGMTPLLLDAATPFASTYRANLAAVLPLRESSAEPAPGSARRQAAVNLLSAIERADCGGLGFSLKTNGETGVVVLDDDLRCKALPAGAHLVSVAGVALVAQPRAAWHAVQHACTAVGRFEAGFDGHAPVTLACPNPVPELPPQIVLPDDVLVRLGLSQSNS